MLFNPRFGSPGLLAMPYYLVFEFLGSAVEVLGLVLVFVAWLLGVLSLSFFLAFLAVSVLLSLLLSIAALLLEEYAIRRYERGSDIARLVGYAVLENFGYRQLTALFRCIGVIDLIRRRRDWGEMRRRGLERRAEVPLPPGEKARG
jgi:hypothetical protein